MIKMTEKETTEYIKLQLPIIKGELQQVTNKINTYIAVFATTLAFLLTNIIFTVTLLPKNILYWILLALLIDFLVLTMLSLGLYLWKRKSKDKEEIIKKIEKLNFNSSIKDIDPYYYRSYTKISLKAYLKMFSWDDSNDKYALEQIYVNSMNITFKSVN